MIVPTFWTRKAGPKKPLCDLLVVVVVISSLKIHKAFLIRSAAQGSFAYTFMLIFPTDLPAEIFSCHNTIISVTKVHVIDLKLHIEPSVNMLPIYFHDVNS